MPVRRVRLCRRHLLPLLGLLLAGRAEGQYAVTNYTTRDGLPQNTIGGLAQTPDGFLWIATFDGLVRYDGIRFAVFDRGNTPAMKGTLFQTLVVDGDGTLWAGSSTGVLSYRRGHFAWHDPATSSAPVHAANAQFYPGYVRRRTPHWSYDSAGLHRAGTDQPLAPPFTADDFDQRSIEDRQGRLWVGGAEGGVFRVDDRGVHPLGTREGFAPTLRIGGIDRDGHLWLFDETTLLRVDSTRITAFPLGTLIRAGAIRWVIADREGTVWVGTGAHGLFKLGPRFLAAHSTETGLFGPYVNPILEGGDGTIWVGNSGAVSRLKGLRTTTSVLMRGTGGRLELRTGAPAALRALPGRRGVWSLAAGLGGTTWLGSQGIVVAVRNDRIVDTIAAGADVWAMVEEPDGTLWIGTTESLLRWRRGVVERITEIPEILSAGVTAMYLDPAGTLWVGTTRGLARRVGERFESVPALAGEQVRALYADPDGVLWIGTFNDGLRRMVEGRLLPITTRQGLSSNGAFAILPDDQGRFWISSNQGIYRVSRRALNELAAGRITSVTSVGYGEADGLRTAEMNGGRQPAAIRTREGLLWFGSQDGVVVLDPARVPTDSTPPVVTLERVVVDGADLPPQDSIHLHPGETDLVVRYAAPSSVQARAIQFRYRLEGLEDRWTDAGRQHEVHYSHLPPGAYRLRVIAGNADGVWAERGLVIPLRVDARFYQTREFLILVGLTLLLILAAVARARVRALEAQERALTRLVEERTSELQAANQQLQQLASEDPLTGLANRRHLLAFLQREWQVSRRSGAPLTLLLLDVDHFKAYNDTYGHPEGDTCLTGVARVLRRVVSRSTDLVARFGGEEFAVVLTGNDRAGAERVAEEIRRAVAGLVIPHRGSRTAAYVTVSIGVATVVATDGHTMEGLISRADQALYQAKESGRDRVVVTE